ncbi:MAG: alpha/beta hydrolase family protein [Blastocatellia bacterium]
MIYALKGLLVMALLLTGSIFSIFLKNAAAHQSPTHSEAEGIWQGTLKVSGMELHLLFHISKGPDGNLTATLDSPDQGATGIAVDTVTLQGRALHVEIKRIALIYDGELADDGAGVTGTLTQGGQKMALNLTKLEKAPERLAVIEPKRPFPYDEQDVSYENKAAGVTLAGTLTLPRAKGPYPVVLLITGSGPQDRDETLLGHKPFLVLSDYLTRNGIAVLRVDDRGIGKSTGKFGAATTEDFATDVMAGVEYLRTRKEVDPKQIGLIGHSEGGIIAPMVAAKSPDVAFIVMMAGTGISGEQILYLQGELIARANGTPEAEVEAARKIQEQMFAVVKTEPDRATAQKELHEIVQKARASMTEDQKKEASEAAINEQISALMTPWFKYFMSYDPRPALERVKCPVLAVNGAKDLQVPPKQNLPQIEEALEKGGNSDHEIVELPGLNHLFQTCNSGSPSEYSKIAETMSPLVLETIGDWIHRHTKRQ